MNEVNGFDELIDYIVFLLDKFLDDLVLQLQTECSKLITGGNWANSPIPTNAVGPGALNLGLLLNSSVIDHSKNDKSLTYNALYGPYVEYGTRPHWAPLAPLVEWARIKFQMTPKEAVQFGKHVQLKIAKKGTPPRPFLRVAMHQVFSPQNLERTLKIYFPD